MRGQNDDELPEFVEMTRDKPINVRFIEYMPFDGNVWSHNKMVSYREMVAAVTESFPQGLEPLQVRQHMCSSTVPRIILEVLALRSCS